MDGQNMVVGAALKLEVVGAVVVMVGDGKAAVVQAETMKEGKR